MAESCVVGDTSRLIAIDPGENSGFAFFVGGVLTQAKLDHPSLTHATFTDELIIEIPRVYPGPRKEDPNDLIKVAKCAGRWIQNIGWQTLHEVHPQEWKGQVPKEIHNARVLAKLTPAERALIPKLPQSKLHNVIDAIGLGLFALGRMGRGA